MGIKLVFSGHTTRGFIHPRTNRMFIGMKGGPVDDLKAQKKGRQADKEQSPAIEVARLSRQHSHGIFISVQSGPGR
ncbi:MAG: hypothetical protein ABIH24_06655 [Verrucomicrobiota bacterium]